ncbi:MAG TPA: hypothetical protein VLE73_01595 [Candidatus Saccharimonadales bacterium]|nr:hypothetical protein [Candidatus Saccharimonadales bacterium]
MYQRSLTRLLLTPSISSGLIVFAGSAVVLGYSGWLYISDNQIFYDYLFGAYGLKTFVWQNSLGFSVWTQAFLSSPVAYYLLVGGVAVAVGVAVFTVLQAAGVFVRGTAELIDQVEYKGPTRGNALREILSRLVLRVTSLIGWAVYAAFFVSMLVPFSIVLNQTGIEHLRSGTWYGVFGCLGAYVLLALGLHLHVVFIRLTALRPRLFGGDDVIQEAEAQSGHGLGE